LGESFKSADKLGNLCLSYGAVINTRSKRLLELGRQSSGSLGRMVGMKIAELGVDVLKLKPL